LDGSGLGCEPELFAVDKFGAAEARFDGEDLLDRFDIKVNVRMREVIHPGRDMSRAGSSSDLPI